MTPLVVAPSVVLEPIEHRYWHIGALGAKRELAAVTKVIKAAGFSSDGRYYTDAHRQRGTAVHDATLIVDAHRTDWERHLAFATSDLTCQYALSYALFLDDHAVVWRLREQIVADVDLGVAGMVDAVGDIDAIQDAIVDFKSGADDPSYGVQVAGYERMAPKVMPIARRRFVLLLQADGSRAKLIPKTDRSDYAAFLAAVTCFHWRHANARLS